MASSAEVNARRALVNASKQRRKPSNTDNAVNAILEGARNLAPLPEVESDSGGLAGFLETPVIKHALDALSVGTYATANIGDEVVKSAKAAKEGNAGEAILKALTAVPVGLAEGVQGGLGNDDHTTTWSNVLDNAIGKPSEGDTAGNITRGVAGFVGDVALDPLTYLTVGIAPAIKGGVRGAQKFAAAEKAEKKVGDAVSVAGGKEQFGTSKIDAFVKGAKKGHQNFKMDEKAASQFRRQKRQLKNKSHDEQVEWLEENVDGLLPAVAMRLIDDVKRAENAQEAVRKTAKKPNKDAEDLGVAVDAPKIIDENINEKTLLDNILNNPSPGIKSLDDIDVTPGASSPRIRPVGLGKTKPPTLEAKVVDRLSNLRAEAPVKAADATPTGATAAPEIEFDNLDRWMKDINKNGGPQTTAAGTIVSSKKLYNEYRVAKQSGPDAIREWMERRLNDSDRTSFLRETEDVIPPKSVGDNGDGTTGNIRYISKDIRAGKIDAKQFEDLAGTDDPKKVAAFLDKIAKTPAFKEADKELRAYNTGTRLGISKPERGISGHALLARVSDNFDAEDILASKIPATEAEAFEFLEAKYTESALKLAAHPRAAELRSIADDLFYSAVGIQKLPGGEKVTKFKKATTNGPGQGAKLEKEWNTHANMYHVGRAIREGQRLGKTASERDSIIMTILNDVDNRLRLAGIDPHLSNMKIARDSVVVRLSASDVFNALPKSARMKYIFGTGHRKNQINEVLPTTILDVAETLVRSITRLNPDGTPNFDAGTVKAIDALSGTFGVKHGNRTIGNNLDEFTERKNWEAVIVDVAGRDSPEFKAFQSAGLHADKKKVYEQVKAVHPEKASKAQMKRLDANVNGVLQVFLKGLRDGEPNVLSDLVATNMRNAAVHSGNVTERIAQMSKEHAERILATFNGGTPTEFLNELVATPPWPHNGKIDPAIFKMREELKLVAQSQVVNAHEAKHFEAIGDVTKNASKPHNANEAAARNAKAYQPLPEREAVKTIKKEEITEDTLHEYADIAMRETNIDVVYRTFGPSRFFNKRAGLNRSFDTVTSSTHAATHIMTGFHNVLKSWAARGVTKEQARVAFKEIQANDGTIPLSPFAQEMNDTISFMFSADPKVNNFLTRNTVGPEHFNKVLDSIMEDEAIRVPIDATPAEMAQVWKTWNVENPIDFFSKMMRAMVKTSEDISMGASFTREFGSSVPAPGYKKIRDSSNSSEFLPLIDNTLYYPVELIDEIPMISRLMLESRTFKPGTKLHTFITRVFDPVISNLKMTQTTLKPGHHVMSVAGDGLRNSLAGMGGSTKEYGQMWRIIHTKFGALKDQGDMDKWANVKEIVHSVDVGKNTNQRGEKMLIGGKQVYVGHDELYSIMQQKGVILPPHIGGVDVDEMADFDQFSQAGNAVIRGIDKVTSSVDRLANPNHGKYSLNNFTAHRDSLMRGALFLHFAQSRSFKSLDDAAEYASRKVREWAPTSADLGGFEAKIMRRTFMYYTWLRGMLPRVIEGAITRPGVAMAPSKAMYNLAIANGLDPSSIGDPFPQDSMFPSWYSEKVLGPQWETSDGDLWGFNPTSPVMDVANSLGSGVTPEDLLNGKAIPKIGGTLLNMATPWAKAPAELLLGQTLDGGRPIEDNSQYLTDMIGPVRVASRIAGKDPIPSINPDGQIAFANRTGSKYEFGLDDDFGPNAAHELVNWALGMGATNYTSDSALNSAKYEEAQKLRQEKEEWNRYGG